MFTNPSSSRAVGLAALAVILALTLWGVLTPWGLGLDFANFHDAGQKLRVWEPATLYDPTAPIGGEPSLGRMTFFSAPITAFLYVPLAMLPPHAGMMVFKLLGAAAMLSGLGLLYRQIRPIAGPGFFGLFWLAAAVWQPFWTVFRVGGQTTPFVFLLLVLAHGAWLRGAGTGAALALTVAVLVKPAFAPLALLLFILGSQRFRLTALIAAAVVAALSLAIFGWPLHREFLAVAAAEGASMQVPWMNSSPVSWLGPLFLTPADYAAGGSFPAGVALAMNTLRLVIVLGLVAVLVGHLRRPLHDRARRHVVFATGLFLVIALSPVVWAHYLSILFIPVAVLIAGRAELPAAARGLLWLAVLAGVAQSMILVRQMELRLGTDSGAVVLAAGMMKSLPAFLLISLWLGWRAAVGRILALPGWPLLAGTGRENANILGITAPATPDQGSAG